MRQRQKADGSWRLWWEPTPAQRAMGAAPEDLDANRPTWSKRRAEELRDAAAGKAKRRAGSGGRTLAALRADYCRSSMFKRLSASTRKGYEADFKRIEDRWGTTHVARIARPDVRTWYEGIEATAPTMAGKLVRSMSVLMSHAELRGWRPENSNPCSKLKVAPIQRRKRFASWDELDALVKAAEDKGWPNMACAILLAVYSGQRQADVIACELDEMRDVQTPDGPVLTWDLERQKRGNRGIVPMHSDVAARLRNRIAGAADGQVRLLLDDVTGAPWSGDLFRKRWAEIRAAAGKACPSIKRPALQFRDLRRTFGILARQGGATRDDIADVLGNGVDVSDALAGIYTPAQIAATQRAVSAVRRPAEERRA
ncbi:hypothetical protein CDO87_03580 [Sagittula sp. P11]|nr:hypothetical protein CDO87_03580 [Sagittula sp. P11]